MDVKKILNIILGCIGLGIDAGGAIDPMLPPFRFCCWPLSTLPKAPHAHRLCHDARSGSFLHVYGSSTWFTLFSG